MGTRVYSIIIGGIVLVLVVPPVLFWFMFGRAPERTPAQARELLLKETSPWRLIDVRDEKEFALRHISGAENRPWKEISGIRNRDEIPAAFKGGKILLLCDNGLVSAAATLRLREIGVPDVFNVRGGMTMWISLTAFVIKPLYMIASFILAIILLRRRDVDLRLLGWSMAAFFAGEAFCAVNFPFFAEDSLILEFLHSSGMMISFALSLLTFFDRRIIWIEEKTKPCAFLPLCRSCWKHDSVSCTAVRFSLYLLPAAALCAAIPLLAPFIPVAYNTDILGTWYTFMQPMPYQIYETVALPAFAMIFFLAAWVILAVRGIAALGEAKALASLGAGSLGFSLFRLVLLAVYRDSMSWYGSWEEITEFLFIAGLALALYFFRKGLFRPGATEGEGTHG